MVIIGGFVFSINTCLKHAVDGYSFWGTVMVARIGKTHTSTGFAAANTYVWAV